MAATATATNNFYTAEQAPKPHLRLVASDGVILESATLPGNELALRRQEAAPKIGRVSLELQAKYDAITELAELTDGNMQVPIELTYDAETDDLIGPDGRSVNQTTLKAIEDAEQKAATNPNFAFEIDRRKEERKEFFEQLAMAKGNGFNAISTISDNPLVEMGATQSMGGYNHVRKQAMYRVSLLKPDGKILMISQSLDQSNRQGLEAIDKELGFKPKLGTLLSQRRHLKLSLEEQDQLVDRSRIVYDAEMVAQFGGEWFAGRTPADYRNTYDFVCAQKDLIEVYVSAKLNGTLNDKFMYDLAATMQARFEADKQVSKQSEPTVAQNLSEILNSSVRLEAGMESHRTLQLEMNIAGNSARAEGRTFSACGSTYSADGTKNSLESWRENSGLGGENGESGSWHGGKKYKNTKCVSCNEVKSEVGACHICEDCVKHPKKKK